MITEATQACDPTATIAPAPASTTAPEPESVYTIRLSLEVIRHDPDRDRVICDQTTYWRHLTPVACIGIEMEVVVAMMNRLLVLGAVKALGTATHPEHKALLEALIAGMDPPAILVAAGDPRRPTSPQG